VAAIWGAAPKVKISDAQITRAFLSIIAVGILLLSSNEIKSANARRTLTRPTVASPSRWQIAFRPNGLVRARVIDAGLVASLLGRRR
jgi:hypothetical protein